jgi:uncharacterized membrane protein (GlpM family)
LRCKLFFSHYDIIPHFLYFSLIWMFSIRNDKK